MPRMRGFKVVGMFSAGMYEFDRNLALRSHRAMRRACIAWATT